MGLADNRAGLDSAAHFREVDRDLQELAGDIDELKRQTTERLAAIERQLEKLLWTVVGATISAATAVLLLALNLMVGT
jgi:hypothetical protein